MCRVISDTAIKTSHRSWISCSGERKWDSVTKSHEGDKFCSWPFRSILVALVKNKILKSGCPNAEKGRAYKYSLVKGLIFDAAFPKMLAGLRGWREVCQNDLSILCIKFINRSDQKCPLPFRGFKRLEVRYIVSHCGSLMISSPLSDLHIYGMSCPQTSVWSPHSCSSIHITTQISQKQTIYHILSIDNPSTKVWTAQLFYILSCRQSSQTCYVQMTLSMPSGWRAAEG